MGTGRGQQVGTKPLFHFFYQERASVVKREQELNALFENIDESQKTLIKRLIGEVAFLEEQMTLCKKLPLIIVNPQNSNQQKLTKSAKLYKELSQSYISIIRTLASILQKADEQAGNELLQKLLEFQ